MLESFGQIISSERKKRTYKLKDVATHILKADRQPISIQFLDNLEKGLRTPFPELVPQFAQLFGLSADLLFATLGLFSPDLIAHVDSREQLINAFEAFRQALAQAPQQESSAKGMYTFVRQDHSELLEEYEITGDTRVGQMIRSLDRNATVKSELRDKPYTRHLPFERY